MFSRYPASHHQHQVSRTRRKRQDKFKRKRIGNISLRNQTDRQSEPFIRTTLHRRGGLLWQLNGLRVKSGRLWNFAFCRNCVLERLSLESESFRSRGEAVHVNTVTAFL